VPTKYVKIGWLGTVGVDKKQRAVKMRYPAVSGDEAAYTNVTVSDVNC